MYPVYFTWATDSSEHVVAMKICCRFVYFGPGKLRKRSLKVLGKVLEFFLGSWCTNPATVKISWLQKNLLLAARFTLNLNKWPVMHLFFILIQCCSTLVPRCCHGTYKEVSTITHAMCFLVVYVFLSLYSFFVLCLVMFFTQLSSFSLHGNLGSGSVHFLVALYLLILSVFLC